MIKSLKNKNKGFTILELMVAMTIFSLLVLFVADLYIEITRFYVGSLSNRSAQQNVKIAMETITRYSKQATTARWDFDNKELRLNIKDSDGYDYTVVFINDRDNDEETSIIKMGIGEIGEEDDLVTASQPLTSEDLYIKEFTITYSPGIPVILNILISAQIEEEETNVERGVSGANEIKMETSIATKGQYNY